MRTNIDFDEKLMMEIMQLAKLTKKKKAMEGAIARYARYLKRQELLDLFGKVKWEGDLDEMRTSKYL